jgi:hypothetical protein
LPVESPWRVPAPKTGRRSAKSIIMLVAPTPLDSERRSAEPGDSRATRWATE